MNLDKTPFHRPFDTLESLADTISEVLNSPVTIEDANHHVLAYSSHHPETDPARIATIVGRRVTTHDEPTYLKHQVLHYAVPNIPEAVPRTSTIA